MKNMTSKSRGNRTLRLQEIVVKVGQIVCCFFVFFGVTCILQHERNHRHDIAISFSFAKTMKINKPAKLPENHDAA